MIHPDLIYSVTLALMFAVAAGLVGSFALMKRMLLAGDVISHLALPGLGLAFLMAGIRSWVGHALYSLEPYSLLNCKRNRGCPQMR